MTKEIDYKFTTCSSEDTQKLLNQWKHMYDLDILYINAFDVMHVFMLTKRTRKE